MEIKASGTTVWTEEAGSGEKRVLLLHGWGCSTELMKPLADRLQANYHVLSLDFPGHGKSGKPPMDWGVPEYAACLLEVLRQKDFLPCAVIAHSFGCRIAIWAASQDPSLFTQLILTGAAGIRKPATAESQKRSAEYKKLKGIAQTVRGLKIFGSLPDKMEDALRKKYGSADYNALDADMRGTFSRVVSQDLTECLPKIQQPTLLLFGTNDTETPLWMGQKMAELIPDAALIPLEGGTHFAYLEQLNRVLPIAESFLNS